MIEQLLPSHWKKSGPRGSCTLFRLSGRERGSGKSSQRPGAPLLVNIFSRRKPCRPGPPGRGDAARHGRSSGKEEAWRSSTPAGARIALGLKQPTGKESLEAAAQATARRSAGLREGTDGNVFHVPPGTIHAIGGGISLVEIQQNADITYRLYDYGRPRELHLDLAVDAALAGPYRVGNQPRILAAGRSLVVNGARFQVERWRGPGKGRIASATGQPITLIPLAGTSGWTSSPSVRRRCGMCGDATVDTDAAETCWSPGRVGWRRGPVPTD